MGLKARRVAGRFLVIALALVGFSGRLGNALGTWLDAHDHSPTNGWRLKGPPGVTPKLLEYKNSLWKAQTSSYAQQRS